MAFVKQIYPNGEHFVHGSEHLCLHNRTPLPSIERLYTSDEHFHVQQRAHLLMSPNIFETTANALPRSEHLRTRQRTGLRQRQTTLYKPPDISIHGRQHLPTRHLTPSHCTVQLRPSDEHLAHGSERLHARQRTSSPTAANISKTSPNIF